MSSIKTFAERHPLLTHFVLVLAISWGGALAIFGLGVFLGTQEVSFVGGGPLAYLAFLAGPSSPSSSSNLKPGSEDGVASSKRLTSTPSS